MSLLFAASIVLSTSLLPGRVALILADGRVQLVRAGTDSVLVERQIVPYRVDGPWQMLVQSLGARRLVGLLRPRKGEAGDPVIFSMTLDGERLTRRSLRIAESNIHAIALAPKTGDIVLVGTDSLGVTMLRVDATTLKNKETKRLLRVSTKVDSATRVTMSLGQPWVAYSASMSEDEKVLWVSFHGATDGAMRFDLRRKATPCSNPTRPVYTCIDQHGSVVISPWGILAATGSSTVKLLDSAGNATSIETGLAGNHIMEFGVDPARGQLFVAGSCSFAGGLAIVSGLGTASKRVRMVSPSYSRGYCGERLAVPHLGDWFALVSLQPPLAASSGPGTISYFAVEDGRLIFQGKTSGPPLDVLALR